MISDFDKVKCNNVFVQGRPLIVHDKVNPVFLKTETVPDLIVNGKINPKYLPQKTQTNHGTFVRKDINAGQIRLEVYDNIELYRNDEVVATLMNGNTEIGFTHILASGIQYILTADENMILIIDTSKHAGWSPNTSGIRKFLLTKK